MGLVKKSVAPASKQRSIDRLSFSAVIINTGGGGMEQVTEGTDTLQRKGLVRRTGSDSDRRVVLVELTEDAQPVIEISEKSLRNRFRLVPAGQQSQGAFLLAKLEASSRVGWLSDEIQRRLFDWLDAPIERVTGGVASPSISKVLERAAFARTEEVAAKLGEILGDGRA